MVWCWGKVVFGTLVFLGVFVLVGVHMSLRPANAEVQVANFNATAKQTEEVVSATSKVINDAVRIANQVRRMATLSPEAVLAHTLGLDGTLSRLVDVYGAYNGLMKASANAATSMDRAFGKVEDFFSGETSLVDQTQQKNALQTLEKMNQDSIYLSKKMQGDLEKSVKGIQDASTDLGNAVGEKGAWQITANVEAMNTTLLLNDVSLSSMKVGNKASDLEYLLGEKAKELWQSKKVQRDFEELLAK